MAVAATVTLAGFASPASAALSFSRTDYPLPEGTSVGGSAPRSDVVTPAALIDLNHDAKLDIVVANGYTGKVVVMLNHGDGTFAPAQSFAACQNSSLVSDTVGGQLNPQTDQNPDVAVTCEVEGGVWRLLGDGHGALGPPQSISPSNAVGPLLLGHLSNNPFGDLVYQNVASPYEWPCLASLDGSGGVGTANCFQEDYTHAGHPSTIWHFHPNDCSGGDEMLGFGYDTGSTDWAFQDTEYNGLWKINPMDPSPSPCYSPFHTSGYGHDSGIAYSSNLGNPRPSGIAAGDLDGDAHPDVVMADSGGTVHVQPDDHTGSFPTPATPSSFTSAGPISSIALADFNGDGRLDAAAGESNRAGVAFDTEVPTWVAIHLGHGNATFDPALTFPVAGQNIDYSGGEPHIAVGDLNGDGKPDIVSVAGESGAVTVLLNTSPAPTSANTALPTISGKLVRSQTLTEAHGAWTNNPTGFRYQWEDCNRSGAGCAAITGATGQHHVLTATDVGHTIRVQETASNAGGTSVPASSAATAAVRASTRPPTPAQLKASVLSQLSPKGKSAMIAALLKNGAYSFSFTALTAGGLRISWYLQPKGAHVAKVKPKALLVATGSARFSEPGKMKVRIKLTGKSKRLLKRSKRLTLTAKGTFTPRGKTAVTASRRFTLRS